MADWRQSPIRPGQTRDLTKREAVSIDTACALVGVARRTIYNWLEAGRLEFVRLPNGRIRIFVDSLWRDPLPSSTEDPDDRPDPTVRATRRL